MSWQFTVGVRAKGKAERIVVGAEDALIAALKVKAERPEAAIMYVRRLNRRGDTRHPPHVLTGGRAPVIESWTGETNIFTRLVTN